MILYKSILFLLLLSASTGAQVKIKTANLQHGQYTNGTFSFSGQAALLSAGSADIVGVNEASVGDLSGWDAGFTTGGMTRAVYAEHPATGDGNAIYYRSSTVTISNTYTHQLANVANPTSGSTSTGWAGTSDIRRTVVAVKASIGGKEFYLVSAHLCPSACADASGSPYNAQRVSQAQDLVSWINSTLTGGAPVFIIGDLNMSRTRLKEPSGFQIDVFLEAGYTDLWASGVTAGTATANWGDRDADGQPDMPLGLTATRTLGAQGIDYVLIKGSAGLTSIDVPDLRATCSVALTSNGAFKECPDVTELVDFPEDQGVRPSDHNWLTAVVVLGKPKCRFHTLVRCA